MRGRFSPPLFVIAAALFGLIALLATLQYRWLGRISDAERESRRSTLGARAAAFASDFDKELTLAYMLFQVEPLLDATAPDDLASRLAGRYERWQATSRYPRLIKDVYLASRDGERASRLARFNPSTRVIEPAEWPAALTPLREQLAAVPEGPTEQAGRSGSRNTVIVRSVATALLDEVPALVVPMPMVFLNAAPRQPPAGLGHFLSYTVLVLDREYMAREVLPALARQHLRGLGDGVDYELAVVSHASGNAIYRSRPGFEPPPGARADASADLFQVRVQEFAQMAADVRRFAATVAVPGGPQATVTAVTKLRTAPPRGGTADAPADPHAGDARPLSIVVDQTAALRDRAVFTSLAGSAARGGPGAARWKLLVKHPSGSLEAAVNSARRRNLILSSSILAVLGASMALLVMTTRRSQQVARQQMEFVAAVSHELRTPLAVIRSAGDNLADGVVDDPAQIRNYGDLVRSEGRRLSEMVEQILEFAGIQSGQRRFEPKPVDIRAVLNDVLSASTSLIESARITVEMDVPDDLPPVLGDDAALRRVFQNLIGNAIKYGGDNRWIGLRARGGGQGRPVCVSVADRGIGIAAAEQARIFEPFYRTGDVIAAQIQGAGLGLSLVQRIVEAHGGRVAVTSTPGSGSEFRVYLPAAGPEPVPGADPRAAEAPRYT